MISIIYRMAKGATIIVYVIPLSIGCTCGKQVDKHFSTLPSPQKMTNMYGKSNGKQHSLT